MHPSSYQELKFVINFPLIETPAKKKKKKEKNIISHMKALPKNKIKIKYNNNNNNKIKK
jgi:hypothetical protein